MSNEKSDNKTDLKSYKKNKNESEIKSEEEVISRKKPNLICFKAVGYAIPLVVVGIAIFWVIIYIVQLFFF